MRLQLQLKKIGYDAFITEKIVNDKRFLRVRVGQYYTLEQADYARNLLENEGCGV